MKSTELLAHRIREVFLNGTWIANTNYKDQLLELNFEQATYKVNSLNTIAVLIFHVNYYVAGILNYLEKGELEIKDKYSFELPNIKSEDDWQKLCHSFISNSEKIANFIELMRDEKLDEVFVIPKYGSYQRNINGLIEHSYYHLGQIVLIKKIIQSEKNLSL